VDFVLERATFQPRIGPVSSRLNRCPRSARPWREVPVRGQAREGIVTGDLWQCPEMCLDITRIGTPIAGILGFNQPNTVLGKPLSDMNKSQGPRNS